MRPVGVLACLGLVLAGCQSPTPTAPTPTPPAVSVRTVADPVSTTQTDIALVRRNQRVTVGMRADDAFRIFRDPKDGGFEYERLPAGFGSGYHARSWEGGPKGFGVITFKDQVVLAMFQERHSTFDRALELVQAHQDHMGRVADKVVAGKRLNYWFWEQDDQRLMIVAFQKGSQEGVEITAAMGDRNVMDAIGAKVSKATSDFPRVDRALAQQDEQKKGPNTISGNL